MADPFETYMPGLTSPPSDVVEITPDDDNELDTPIRALRAATAGNVVVVTYAGNERVMRFTAGETRVQRIKQVRENGTDSPASTTTATGLEGHV